MTAVGGVGHLFYTSKLLLIILELNHLIYKHVYCIYIYAMKAVGGDRHLFCTSKILLIVLELNHLIYIPRILYIYIYIYTQ